jgi:non-heme chloroperoxidase
MSDNESGTTLSYETHGEGQPIVFIHGMMLNRKMWSAQVDDFKDSHRVIVVDQRGHGETGGTPVEPYTIGLLADDIHALVEELELESPIICGHSLGATVAVRYTRKYPDEVSKLVLVGQTTNQSTPSSLMSTIFETVTIGITRLLGKDRADQVGKRIASVVSSGGLPDSVSEAGQQVSEEEFLKLRAVVGTHDLFDLGIDEIEAPTLLVCGEDESGNCAEFEAAMENAQSVVIEDAGHISPVQNADEFSYYLDRFLAQ